jgi:hypothetical protein
MELVEVADVRRRQHGHAQRGRAAAAQAVVEQRVFFGQAVVAAHRQHAGQRHAGQRVQVGRAGRQQRRVTPETVQHKTLQQRLHIGRQQRPGAVAVGKRPAAVDVADQQRRHRPRRLRPARRVQVDVVVRRQVDLGRRARPFDHDQVVPRCQAFEGITRRVGQPQAAFAPGHARQRRVGDARHHHLAGRVALGFQQHGVHVHRRQGASGQRLKVLGGTDLAQSAVAARHHAGVVAHVLRLERRHVHAAACRHAAQGGGQPALAGAAGAPPDDDAACHASTGVR